MAFGFIDPAHRYAAETMELPRCSSFGNVLSWLDSSRLLQRIPRWFQVQAKPFPGNGPRGDGGERVFERLLRLLQFPAVHQPEVRLVPLRMHAILANSCLQRRTMTGVYCMRHIYIDICIGVYCRSIYTSYSTFRFMEVGYLPQPKADLYTIRKEQHDEYSHGLPDVNV